MHCTLDVHFALNVRFTLGRCSKAGCGNSTFNLKRTFTFSVKCTFTCSVKHSFTFSVKRTFGTECVLYTGQVQLCAEHWVGQAASSRLNVRFTLGRCSKAGCGISTRKSMSASSIKSPYIPLYSPLFGGVYREGLVT